MPRKVCEELALAEEDRGIVGIRSSPELYTEETAVYLFSNILDRNMTLGEEPQAEADSCRLEVLRRWMKVSTNLPGLRRLLALIVNIPLHAVPFELISTGLAFRHLDMTSRQSLESGEPPRRKDTG